MATTSLILPLGYWLIHVATTLLAVRTYHELRTDHGIDPRCCFLNTVAHPAAGASAAPQPRCVGSS
jgi:hypothetical protein